MSKEPDFKYECGSVLKDEITGFKGVVIARTQWLALYFEAKPVILKR